MQVSLIESPKKGTLLIRLFEEGTTPSPQHFFSGKSGESWWKNGTELWIGLGKNPAPFSIQKIFRKTFHQYKQDWPKEIAIDMAHMNAEQSEAVINGVMLGGYDVGMYKSDRKSPGALFGSDGHLLLITSQKTSEFEKVITRAKVTADVQLRIMDLMNAPSNKKNPGTLAKWALDSADAHRYHARVYDQTELNHEGFFALLSVNKGSPEDAALIVTEYTPEQFEKTVAFVGKGVTFDTGGISVKPSSNMHLMKSDMGGAAAVLGIVELAARLQLPVKVIGIIPSTENCVDGNSTKPGDVINSYSGKTIEVIDTDAEGRIILADGLSYAVREYKPDVLIDLATLTGSIIQTLGYHAAGLFTSNDDLAQALEEAGEQTHERLWRLPIWDDYSDEIKSDIADVKNYHGKPLAGAIVAAKFLEFFTENHSAWAHLDIAGTAFGDTDFVPGRAGTAYGIRLLRNYLEQLVEK